MVSTKKRWRSLLMVLAVTAGGLAAMQFGSPVTLNAQDMAFDDDGRLWYYPCLECHAIEVDNGNPTCMFAPGEVKCRTYTYSICTSATGGFQVVEGSVKGCIEVKEEWYWS
jgi:hypothetical protein